VPGADTLAFGDGSAAVRLIDFRWSHPAVEGEDRVGGLTTGASGSVESTGRFTLRVPEPPRGLLAACALATGALLARTRQCGATR
jgi:hypothetical protein